MVNYIDILETVIKTVEWWYSVITRYLIMKKWKEVVQEIVTYFESYEPAKEFKSQIDNWDLQLDVLLSKQK